MKNLKVLIPLIVVIVALAIVGFDRFENSVKSASVEKFCAVARGTKADQLIPFAKTIGFKGTVGKEVLLFSHDLRDQLPITNDSLSDVSAANLVATKEYGIFAHKKSKCVVMVADGVVVMTGLSVSEN